MEKREKRRRHLDESVFVEVGPEGNEGEALCTHLFLHLVYLGLVGKEVPSAHLLVVEPLGRCKVPRDVAIEELKPAVVDPRKPVLDVELSGPA